MAEVVCSSQQTQCQSAADFIFVDEGGLELAQPRDYSDYFVSVNQTGADARPEISFHSDVSILVDVHLLSGNRVSLEVKANASVESLRQRAQSALITSRGRLLNSSGEVLDGTKAVAETRLKSGDVLTLHVSQVQLQAPRRPQLIARSGPLSTFAALLGDRSVVTWGDAARSGDSSAVQEQLKNVQHIQASLGAFAAILIDGSVVTWGDVDYGGDSSAVQDQLKNVQQIQASHQAFAAIRGDGSVVTWGLADGGGDSSAVQDQLRDVQQIQRSDGAFAAVLGNGSVVTWGHSTLGGDSSAVQTQLKNVQQIQALVVHSLQY